MLPSHVVITYSTTSCEIASNIYYVVVVVYRTGRDDVLRIVYILLNHNHHGCVLLWRLLPHQTVIIKLCFSRSGGGFAVPMFMV